MLLMDVKSWESEKQRISEINDVYVQSKLCKRLAGVTQVISKPQSESTTNRLSHTLLLVNFVIGIAEDLGYSVRLASTGALIHDAGHIVFGHDGEKEVQEFLKDLTFSHGANGVRICRIFGIILNQLIAETVASHSDGDVWINVEFAEDELKWILSKILVAIGDDIVCFSDLRDIIVEKEIQRIPSSRHEKRDPKELEKEKEILHELRGKAINAMNRVLSMAGAELLSSDPTDLQCDQALAKILEYYARDIVEHSRGRNGIFMSEESLIAFKEMKKFVYEQFHKCSVVLASRESCINALRTTMLEAERIFTEEDYSNSTLGRRIQEFLSEVQYGDENPSIRRQVVDFITTCVDKDIEDFYMEILDK